VTPEEILTELIRFPSVVGQPNTAITNWIAQYLKTFGVETQILPGPEGDRANLFATIGPREVPGIVLSGHTDVVPAEEPQWSTDPFRLHAEGDRLVSSAFGGSRISGTPVFRAKACDSPTKAAVRRLPNPIRNLRRSITMIPPFVTRIVEG
jgi:hypothetical protein